MEFIFDKIENTVRKKENAAKQHFPIFPAIFEKKKKKQETSFYKVVKLPYCLVKG